MAAKQISLVQFDSVPENPKRNLVEMERLVRVAAGNGARWIMFHEGTLCDYTPDLARFAEEVPDGGSTRAMSELAKRYEVYICFGLSERCGDRSFITQVFVGPEGYVGKHRKTWIWHEPTDVGFRDEWKRYDPGDGPTLFTMDGVRAACFICADGEAARCIERTRVLSPRVVFYPNNRENLPDLEVFAERAKRINAPMLVTNRVGKSWVYDCRGGCVAYDRDGTIIGRANREGREEILDVTIDL